MTFIRFVLQFPEEDTKIDAVLEDVNRVIHATTSGLVYTYHLSIDTLFSLVCERVFGHALKSIKANHTMVFETKEAINFVTKHAYNLTNEVILSSLLIATIEYMIAISEIFRLESIASASIKKKIYVKDEFGFSSHVINQLLEKMLNIAQNLGIDTAVHHTKQHKKLIHNESILAIENASTFFSQTYSRDLLSELTLETSSSSTPNKLYRILHEIGMSSGRIGVFLTTCLDRESSIQLQSNISQLFARKTGSKLSAIIGLKSFLMPLFCKNSNVIANELQFTSSSNAVILYFRKLLDIDPLSFADVDTWTVETLDILEN